MAVVAAAVASVVLVVALLAAKTARAHNHLVEHIDRQIKHLERLIMTTTQDAVNAVVAQLNKAKGEIVAKIADVQAQLDAAGVAPEVVDLSALNEAAQALDDIVPDVPEVVSDPVPAAEQPADQPAEPTDPATDDVPFDA